MDAGSACANPLLLQWLGEWLDEAKQRNSKGIQTYKKAYDSMKACPLTFNHPSEAQQLHGLGPKLCDRLTAKLVAHCNESGLPMPQPTRSGSKRTVEDGTTSAPAKKARKPRPYVPALRSGAYAILYALSSKDESYAQGFTKAEIIELAQPHCDSSLTAPSDPTKFYTAWNSMKTLIEKDLVFERGRPLRKYALTDDGWEVTNRMRKASTADGMDNQPTIGRLVQDSTVSAQKVSGRSTGKPTLSSGRSRPTSQVDPPQLSRSPFGPISNRDTLEEGAYPSQNPTEDYSSDLPEWEPTPTEAQATKRTDPHRLASVGAPGKTAVAHSEVGERGSRNQTSVDPQTSFLPSFEPVVLRASTFTVHLILDNREVRAKEDRAYIQEELIRRGVRPLMRSLDVGDALWIAKRETGDSVTGPSSEEDEIVLDWIVERKRLDDLIGSIKDGRFREQKFRLRRSGSKNVIYIIEEISMTSESFSKYEEATESAIASTQVVDGYFVKRTQKVDDTIRYLARMTMLLKSMYESKPLHLIPSRVLTPENYLPLLAHLRTTKPSIDYHVTYDAFANLASKSEVLTLRDVYLKMLMCTKGVTGEKALEMQKKWATPNHLIKAYQEHGLDEAGKKSQMDLMASELSGLVGRKKIGKALSSKVAEVWGSI